VRRGSARPRSIVNVYAAETQGRELVDGARAALPPEEALRAADVGRVLTIEDALDLARVYSQ
jgi:hypothetical protein